MNEPYEITKAEYEQKLMVTHGGPRSNYGSFSPAAAALGNMYENIAKAFVMGRSSGKGKWEAGLENAKLTAAAYREKLSTLQKKPEVSEAQFAAIQDGYTTGIEAALKDIEANPTKFDITRPSQATVIADHVKKLDERHPATPEHGALVMRAINNGKILSPEVMSDYPHLKGN